MGEILLIAIWLMFWGAVLVVAARLAWWAFRMVFWTAIIFIATAGKAWRGEL
jgi:hypothetical protein